MIMLPGEIDISVTRDREERAIQPATADTATSPSLDHVSKRMYARYMIPVRADVQLD